MAGSQLNPLRIGLAGGGSVQDRIAKNTAESARALQDIAGKGRLLFS